MSTVYIREVGGVGQGGFFYIYYEQQIKRELQRTHISGCRCNERLKSKTDGSISSFKFWIRIGISVSEHLFILVVVYFQQNKKRRYSRKGKVSR